MRTVASLCVVLAAAGAVGCASTGGAASFLLAAATVLALVLAQRPARGGAPMPRPKCSGEETTVCEGTFLVTHCCPKNADCNFRNPKHVACGYGHCVEGGDVGRCPALTPMVSADRDEKSCNAQYGGSWADACVSRKVAKSCIRVPHSNYTGPPLNPPFRTCGPKNDHCTTHALIEDCYPARGEISDGECNTTWAGQWTKVCLGGRISERCLPRGPAAGTFVATRHFACPNGSCAVGDPTRVSCPPK